MKIMIGKIVVILLISIIAFSCSDEKGSTQKFIFKIADNTENYPLDKNSTLLLLHEGTDGDFTYRDYVITDGELIEGEFGDEIGEYTNATYLIFIQLGARESFAPAGYINSDSWNQETSDYCSYLYATSTNETSIYTDNADGSPIIVSGGFEAGETMKFKFDGYLMYTRLDQSGMNVINTMEEIVLSFEGKIIDKREWD